MKPRFQPGRFLMTRGVSDLIAENADFARHVDASLKRHLRCDWGDCPPDDQRENNFAAENGDLRIFSAFKHPANADWRIWIITEADRSATTILFPSEY